MTIIIDFFYRKCYIPVSPIFIGCKSMEWVIIATVGIFAISLAQVFYFKRSERRVKRVKKEVESLEIEKKKFLAE